jgi:hypothetical protein
MRERMEQMSLHASAARADKKELDKQLTQRERESS